VKVNCVDDKRQSAAGAHGKSGMKDSMPAIKDHYNIYLLFVNR